MISLKDPLCKIIRRLKVPEINARLLSSCRSNIFPGWTCSWCYLFQTSDYNLDKMLSGSKCLISSCNPHWWVCHYPKLFWRPLYLGESAGKSCLSLLRNNRFYQKSLLITETVHNFKELLRNENKNIFLKIFSLFPVHGRKKVILFN